MLVLVLLSILENQQVGSGDQSARWTNFLSHYMPLLTNINYNPAIGLSSKSYNDIIELNRGNRDFLSQQLMWIGIYVVISLAISFVVPFPYSLPIIIGVVILLSFFVRRRMYKRMGMPGSSMFGGDSGSSIRYYCMNCGTKHNQLACPKCGSKMKRVG